MSVAAAKRMARDKDQKFYLAMTMCMFVVVFAGFSPTFFLRFWFPESASSIPPEPIFMYHGFLSATWMLLLPVQAVLIRTKNVKVHRTIGWASIALVTAMVVTGIYGSLIGAARSSGYFDISAPPLVFLPIPLFSIILFGIYFGLAVVWRKKAQYHKRLILLATINMLNPAFARMDFEFIEHGGPLVHFLLEDLFVVAMVAWDWYSEKSIHTVTLWAGSILIASQVARLLFWETETWLGIGQWLVSFVQ